MVIYENIGINRNPNQGVIPLLYYFIFSLTIKADPCY